MGIDIKDLKQDLNFKHVEQTENIRELTEQELRILGGGTGKFSITVTDADGKTVLDENTTFETTGFSLNSNFNVLDKDDLVTISEPIVLPIYYPGIVSFGYIFADDRSADSADS